MSVTGLSLLILMPPLDGVTSSSEKEVKLTSEERILRHNATMFSVQRPPIAKLSIIITLVALLSGALVSQASANEMSGAFVACIKKAVGSQASFLINGGDKAMSRLSPRQRGLVEGCLLTNGRPLGKSTKRPPQLTVSPMDPGSVTAMSKFRSCAGHDFSGMNAQGQVESNRSMKHYLYVDKPWTATGSINIVAPFSGTAIVSVEKDYPLGSWVRILHRNGWAFTAFHVDPSVRDGQRVKPGDVIGTFPPANAPIFMPERMNEPEANFDFTLQSTDGRIASFIDWMSPSVRNAWSDRGFTSEVLTISKSERDAQPCSKDFPDGPGSTGFVYPSVGS